MQENSTEAGPGGTVSVTGLGRLAIFEKKKMITTEKCTILRLYGDVMVAIFESPSRACFRTGLAGMILGALDQNHVLLNPDNPKVVSQLDDLVQDLVIKGNMAFDERPT